MALFKRSNRSGVLWVRLLQLRVRGNRRNGFFELEAMGMEGDFIVDYYDAGTDTSYFFEDYLSFGGSGDPVAFDVILAEQH